MTITQIIFVLVSFLCGALPFSVWIGKFALGKDIRDYGDGNPGTFNVVRAGNIKWGALALILDISKGATPVGLASQVFEWHGIALVLVAIAPILGHAFSPFLGFKGGKAIATMFGTWIGLTLWTVPLVGVITLVISYRLLDSSAWAVMITQAMMLLGLILLSANTELFAVWLLIMFIVIFKHHRELRQLPKLRPRLKTQIETG